MTIVNIKKIRLDNSEIVDIGEGKPTIGIIGLLHGDEKCGRIILDELVNSNIQPIGRLRLIYANLDAEKINKREVEINLNRVFNDEGNTSEHITARSLIPYLKECDYVLDIHSTSYPTEPFAISTKDDELHDKLASFTGLTKYVFMPFSMALDKSLIDEVYRHGGRGISFEAGTHEDESSVIVARSVVYNFLRNLEFIEGEKEVFIPEKFYGIKPYKIPSDSFRAYNTINNFELLKAGTPFGRDYHQEYSLDNDTYPFLFSDKLIDGNVFIRSSKTKPLENEN